MGEREDKDTDLQAMWVRRCVATEGTLMVGFAAEVLSHVSDKPALMVTRKVTILTA